MEFDKKKYRREYYETIEKPVNKELPIKDIKKTIDVKKIWDKLTKNKK